MPNFIALKVRDMVLPFKKGDIEFIEILNGRNVKMLLTRSFESIFFIIIKKSGDKFIIKGDKTTRPAKVAHLQKALEVFRDNFCNDILTQAFAFNPNSLIYAHSPIVGENEILEKISFANKSGIEILIEIGFGSGRHLLLEAENNKNALAIGIEVYKPATEQVAKLAVKRNLKNLFVLNSDARILFGLINSNSIDKIFLHFPVPWDDAPHRRVVSGDFANECERILKKYGIFELRTDSKDYADFSKEIFEKLNGEIKTYKNRELAVISKYEDRWKKQNKDIYEVIFKNHKISARNDEISDFCFENFNPLKISQNFKNETIKGDDFFAHFMEIFTSENAVYLKISLGAFDKPEICFVKISNEKTGYFLKFPLKTKQNFKAHKQINERLKIWLK